MFILHKCRIAKNRDSESAPALVDVRAFHPFCVGHVKLTGKQRELDAEPDNMLEAALAPDLSRPAKQVRIE